MLCRYCGTASFFIYSRSHFERSEKSYLIYSMSFFAARNLILFFYSKKPYPNFLYFHTSPPTAAAQAAINNQNVNL